MFKLNACGSRHWQRIMIVVVEPLSTTVTSSLARADHWQLRTALVLLESQNACQVRLSIKCTAQATVVVLLLIETLT